MRARHALALPLLLSLAALTGGCTEQTHETPEPERGGNPAASQPPTWEGKEDQEEAMERAERALDAVEPEGAAREDSGMTALAKGLDRTFTTRGDRPHTFDIACQAPAPHTLTLTLVRGGTQSEGEVVCGDREADRFDIPAGASFTARIKASTQDTDGLVLWRLDTVP